MSTILSLSKARKAKTRAAKDQQSTQNRILFGRTKAEKLQDKLEKARAERKVGAHRMSALNAPEKAPSDA